MSLCDLDKRLVLTPGQVFREQFVHWDFADDIGSIDKTIGVAPRQEWLLRRADDRARLVVGADSNVS